MTERPTLVFVSTRFLLPVDSGGKIRTTQILSGLKGGKYRVVLAVPATETQLSQYSSELRALADEIVWWPEQPKGRFFSFTRMRHLFDELPIPIRTDKSQQGTALVNELLDDKPDVVVFDFAHADVLAPPSLPCASVLFTHNVEAEIYLRHRDGAPNPLYGAIWNNQYRKMREFEGRAVKKFDVVVAVADRDKEQLASEYGIQEPVVIPTGVDLDFFTYSDPDRQRDIVFIGSMDWMANQDGVTWFMDRVWSKIIAQVPDARMTIVGRSPPSRLIEAASRRGIAWQFTGFVDDVRPFVRGAAVSVIPLNIGGGTRLKAYEAMSMGSPIVSTSIGMEGLPVEPGKHYLRANQPDEFAEAVVQLLLNDQSRVRMARDARAFVEQNCSYTVAAQAFEAACDLAVSRFNGMAA